jgi:D-alanyl-D-alanine carboxypeptidase
MTRLKQYIGEYTGWVNNSPVRDMEGYRGGKHGYTKAANRTLAAVFAESSLGNRELGYIILGSNDIRSDTEALRTAVLHSVEIQ